MENSHFGNYTLVAVFVDGSSFVDVVVIDVVLAAELPAVVGVPFVVALEYCWELHLLDHGVCCGFVQ